MSFFSGLFGGQNETLNQNIPQFETEAGFGTGIGNNDVTAASTWYNDILSGDPTKISQALSPEISAAQGQVQQAKNQTAQFSPRSGGTAAFINGLDANTRAQIINLIGGLQSGSAGALSSLGTTEQGIGLQSREAADAASQQQLENWQNSIVGKGIEGAISSAESYGLGGAETGAFGGNGSWTSDFYDDDFSPSTSGGSGSDPLI